jgi:P63C domain
MTEEKVLKATHLGELKIGNKSIPVAVLEDGTRVITQRGMFVALGMHKNPSRGQTAIANRPGFLSANNLTPFISEELTRSWTPIKLRWPKGSGGFKGNIAFGYKADILPMSCNVYTDAKEAGVLAKSQLHVAEAAKILHRGFAILGITALIDEATGYQEVRDKQALQAILDAFLRKELAAWAKRFPDEFYQEMFRLRNWQWRGMKVNRPSVVGKYTNDLVYERLAPNILQELEERNPKDERGNRKAKHHQWLTEDVGHPALAQHLYAIIGFMRASTTWEQFHRMVQRAFPKRNSQMLLPGSDKPESGDN